MSQEKEIYVYTGYYGSYLLFVNKDHYHYETVFSLLCCSFEADDTLVDELRELSNMKRHSEGTFSNDYSKYLEDRKAQDFVRWLMNNKRSGSVCNPFRIFS